MTSECRFRIFVSLGYLACLVATQVSMQSDNYLEFESSKDRVRLLTASSEKLLYVDGDQSRCVFNDVRGALRLRNGQTMVLNAGDQQVCVFSKNGALIAVHGRKGKGPGEYLAPSVLQRMELDTALVYDEATRRFSLLNSEGRFVRGFSIDIPNAPSQAVTSVVSLSRSRILIGLSDVQQVSPSSKPYAFTQSLYVVATDGRVLGKAGHFHASEHFVQPVPPRLGGVAYWERAFGRRAGFARYKDGFVAGDASGFELSVFDSLGIKNMIWKSRRPSRPVTSTDVEEYRNRELALASSADRQRERNRLKEMPYPTSFPVFRTILSDSFENIWFEPYLTGAANSAVGSTYLVWQPVDRRLIDVLVPSGFRILDIAEGAACGLVANADDLQSLACYRLPSPLRKTNTH